MATSSISQKGNKVRIKIDRENGGNPPSYNRIIISKSGKITLMRQNDDEQPSVQISDGSSPGQSLAFYVELKMSPSQSLAGPLPNILGLSQKVDPKLESSPGPSKNLEPEP